MSDLRSVLGRDVLAEMGVDLDNPTIELRFMREQDGEVKLTIKPELHAHVAPNIVRNLRPAMIREMPPGIPFVLRAFQYGAPELFLGEKAVPPDSVLGSVARLLMRTLRQCVNAITAAQNAVPPMEDVRLILSEEVERRIEWALTEDRLQDLRPGVFRVRRMSRTQMLKLQQSERITHLERIARETARKTLPDDNIFGQTTHELYQGMREFLGLDIWEKLAEEEDLHLWSDIGFCVKQTGMNLIADCVAHNLIFAACEVLVREVEEQMLQDLYRWHHRIASILGANLGVMAEPISDEAHESFVAPYDVEAEESGEDTPAST